MLWRNRFAFFDDLGGFLRTGEVIQDDSIVGGESFGSCGSEACRGRGNQGYFRGHRGIGGALEVKAPVTSCQKSYLAIAVTSCARQSTF